MKTNPFSRILALMAAFWATNPGLFAAPLTWFPGPALDSPLSGAATVVYPGLGNVLIGGDGFMYPEYLTATNLYWDYLPTPFDSVNIAPGAVASGGVILFYGGSDGTNSQSEAIGYSTSGDTPMAFNPMSVARSDFGYAPDASGNAYAIGGLDGAGNPLASAERFNQDNNAWSPIATLPAARYDFPAVFDGTNRIYIFGGRTNASAGEEIASALRYSTRSNNWTALAPMPVATAGSAAAFGKDGKIYVVGGRSGGVATDTVQVYDPTAGSWEISTPLPEALSAAAMGVDSLGRLIVMGGMDINGNDVADVWRSQQFGVPDTAPQFTQYPGTNAIYLQPYASAIAATGNPQPTYLLMSGPPTMTVDPYSGAITWTPQAGDIGTNSIVIRATNYAGYVDWSFTVTVPNPPPAAITGLTVVSVTDNSITLSWDPEPTVVGGVSYAAYLRHSIHDPKGSGGTVWYTQIGNGTAGTSLTISGLTPGLAQDYYLVATAPGGTSGYNSAIAATTTAPQGPTNLWVTAVTGTTVSLAWTPAPGPADSPLYSSITSYAIMERNTTYYPPVSIPTLTNITATNGTVTGLAPGSAHTWFVSGVDAAGNASALGGAYVTVTNPPPAHLSGAALAAGGSFQFSAFEGGGYLQPVTIEATTNPADPNAWTVIGSVTPTGATLTFTDTNSAEYPIRFYRVATP